MTQELEARLNRIKHYRTRYELVATKGEQKVLIVYTDQRTRNSLYRNCVAHGEKIAAHFGSDQITFTDKARDGAIIGDWSVRFERTQREAFIEGERTWIGDL